MDSDRAQSVAVVAAFIATCLVNGLVTSGITVPLDNAEIANSHPVYVVPSGYAFSIWGIIYLLVGVFTVLQAFPQQLSEPHFQKARPVVAASFLFNITWLYMFSYELYWISFVFIVAYALCLLQLLSIFDVGYLDKKQTWRLKLASTAFSANGAWVCVATGLQVCLNLMDEGWAASVDFSMGVLFVVTVLACYNVFRRADVMYAFVSAWALGGIINNQGPSSDWGKASSICHDACVDRMHICTSGLFAEACAAFNSTGTDVQVIAKSASMISFCYVALALVLVALAAGVGRALHTRFSADGNADAREHITQEETSVHSVGA